MSTENSVQKTMEQAAYALQALLIEERAEWVAYMLEIFEDRVDEESY